MYTFNEFELEDVDAGFGGGDVAGVFYDGGG